MEDWSALEDGKWGGGHGGVGGYQLVITRSRKEREDNCIRSFNDIVSCVMEAKADFCPSARPGFYLLDSTDEADYLDKNNLFAMSDVERVLTSPGASEVIISAGRNKSRTMERKKVLCMLKLTHWYALFPLDYTVVLCRKEVGS